MNEASMQLLELLKNDWPHDLKEVRELFKRGADVNATDDDGNTPLLLELRSSFDSADMLEFLSKKGANLQHRNNRGQTALMLAVLRHTLDDFSTELIKGGADIGATDTDGNSVVHYAYGNKKILGLLVKAGLSLNQANKRNQLLLHVPVSTDGGIDTATLKWLLKQGLDPNAKDEDGHTSLHAVSRINIQNPDKAASILIESGADPTVLDHSGTPLSVFHLHEGEPGLAKWFAGKGTHSFDVIILGNLEKVTGYFTPGVSVPPVGWGLTPLHVAALVGSPHEIVDHLIKSTPNLDQTDESGSTALMLANRNKETEIALALVKAGASATGSGGAGNSLEDVVKMANPELLAASIKGKSGAELDQMVGPYTKYFRFEQDSLTCLKLLVENGISPAAVDVDGILARNGGYIEKPMLDLFSQLIEDGASHLLSVRAQQCLQQTLSHNSKEIVDTARGLLIQCLKRGMSSKWSNNESLLHKAVEKRDADLIKFILSGNEDLIFPSEPWRRFASDLKVSPLKIAVNSPPYEEGVSLLLAAGPKVINDEILNEAIECCRSEKIMAMLLDYKARSSGSSTSQDPAVLMNTAKDAAGRGMTDILEGLIGKGLSLNMLDTEGQPIFHTLLCRKHDIQTIDWAKKHGADLSLADSRGQTLLHRVSLFVRREKKVLGDWVGLEDSYRHLIRLGLDINAKDHEGKTPLCIALWYGQRCGLKIIKELVDLGADPNFKDKSGSTALMYGEHDPEKVQLLLDSGVSPHERDANGHTALAYVGNSWQGALSDTEKQFIRLLVAAGLHPDDSGERNHLNASLVADDIPFAIWLLEHKASLARCDLTDKKVISAVTRVIRSRPELVSAQLDSLSDDQRSVLEPLLAKSENAQPEAGPDELPELLRESGWPIAVSSRTPVVVSKVTLPERTAQIEWKDDEQKGILARRRIKSDADSDRKFEEAIARFEKKPGTVKLGTLISATDALFVEYWNTHSVALSPHVQVAATWWGQAITGFRAEDLKYLLARYGLAVLPGILNLASKKPGPVMKALTRVDAHACALPVAKAMTGAASRLARRWLLAYPETAIHGLIVPAVGKPGKERDAAEAALRFLVSKGHREAVEQLAASLGKDVMSSIAEILSVDPRSDYMPKKFPAMPGFWEAGLHPRPLLKDRSKALPLSAIDTLARMMSISTYDARTPALDDVIEACDPVSLADFAWSVFEEWRAKGDSDSNWMFQALAYLGDDRCAKKLTPIIRDWPASNGQAKALMGLEILATIGTDTALAQIQAIARKNKYKPIVARADEMLAAIAEARELTAEQFEDRLVPTLGLAEDGSLALDFGKRRFIGGVDETLKPILRDEAGTALKELPKAGKDDDKALAKAATEQWAEFKTELKPVASLQLIRLENAMIEARRWSGDEFKRLVVHHPLLQKPARSLVWGLFNDKGKLTQSFRILPDGSCIDVKDKPVQVEESSSVGIPHPLLLADEVESWKKVFAKAKQGQAIAQLVRKTYRRKDDAEIDLFGLQGAVVHSKALKGLKSMGWEIAMAGIADVIDHYYRNFPSGDVELRVEPGVGLTDLEILSKEQTLEIKVPKSLNDIEFSELIRELFTLKK